MISLRERQQKWVIFFVAPYTTATAVGTSIMSAAYANYALNCVCRLQSDLAENRSHCRNAIDVLRNAVYTFRGTIVALRQCHLFTT